MAAAALRSEERIGLVVAVAVHVGLAALLLIPRDTPVVTPPDRIEVTISDQVGLTSTSPEPQAEAAPDVAPEIGEPPQPVQAPEPEPVVELEPPQPQPRPVASPRPVPRPTMRPEPPKPVARPTMRPVPRPSPSPRPSARPAARPSAAPARPTPRPTGGSRVGDDFLKGVPGAQNAARSNSPPAQLTGAQKASLGAAISRALKPYWAVPQGPDTELLVTRVRFRLARNGRLVGDPEILSTTGVTDANKAQVQRHREQAIRAIRLAQFELPEELYSSWQTVTTTFDRRLSQ